MRRGIGAAGGSGARGMTRVELVEADAPLTPGPAGRPPRGLGDTAGSTADDARTVAAGPSRARRLWRRWWPVPVVLALAAGGVQYGIDLHERRLDARYAAVPGFVDPVRSPVGTRWRGDDAAQQAIFRGAVVGERVVGPTLHGDGSVDVVAIGLGTGRAQWRTNVLGPNISRSEAGQPIYLVTCAPVVVVPGAAPARVACLASERVDTTGDFDGSVVAGPATTSRVLVLDVATGVAIRSFDVAAAEAIAAGPTVGQNADAGRTAGAEPAADDGTVVLARGLDSGGARVWAIDLATGRQTWVADAPAVPDNRPRTAPAQVWLVGGQVVVEDGTGVVTRLAAQDGAFVERDGRSLAVSVAVDGSRLWLTTEPAVPVPGATGAVTFDDPSDVRATLVGPDGVTTSQGAAVAVRADDGSLPGLLLTDTGRLTAIDTATGEQRWQSTVDAGGVIDDATVLRGVVYVTTSSRDVVAVDGRTGRTLWTYDVPADHVSTGLFTDGRHVVATVLAEADATVPLDLVALDPGDGHVAWTSTAPGTVTYVWSAGRALLGWGDGIRRLG